MSGAPGTAQAGEPEALDRRAIARSAGGFDGEILCFDGVDSTNARLLADFGHRRVLLAEFQSAGRGRRGRRWLMPRGAGVALSFGYRFGRGLGGLGALSLESGLAVAEALSGQVELRLKWPNDLLVGGRKLGGLLIEARGAPAGPGEVVVGLGLNYRLAGCDGADHEFPDQPWTDMVSECSRAPTRNELAGRLIAALDAACDRVQRGDTAGLGARWARFDALAGAAVAVQSGSYETVTGVARGVTDAGALRLVHNDAVIEIQAGEVSLRAR